MIRWPALCSAVLAATLLGAAGASAETPPQTGREQPPAVAHDPSKTLDSLFDRLAKAEDEDEAKGIANLIERRWLRSGSDVTDLLMARAVSAMQPKDQDLPQAIELLDRVIGLEPGWAEAYNRRATAFFMLGDYQRSMLDVRQTLAREPRHFGAIAGLAQILLISGDKKHALEAFRRVLALNPKMPSVQAVVEKLEPDVAGRDI